MSTTTGQFSDGASSVGTGADSGTRTAFWTIGRKIAVIVATTVVIGIGLLLATSTNSQRTSLRSAAAETSVVVTDLLAVQVSGGIRWKKSARIEAAYGYLVDNNDSAVASIMTWDADGASLTSYKSPKLNPYDLSNAPRTWNDRLNRGETVSAFMENHLVVAAPVTMGKGNERVGTLALAWSLDKLRDEVFDAVITQILVAAAVVVALIALLVLSLGRTVTQPVRIMTLTMARLADGDTDAEVLGRRRGDEIGGMAKAVQIFKDNAIEKLRLEGEQSGAHEHAKEEKRDAMLEIADRFERQVQGMVDDVSSSAADMQSTAQRMTATAEEASRQSANVATASDQAATNVQTVAATAEELSASIAEIGRQVGQSATVAGNAFNEAQATNATVQGLAEAAGKIGEIVNLINNIAGQTNLLALNATIEAARAGEAGKGFAVVAQEVKNLAKQTAKATEDISTQIGSVQEETRDAVSAIDRIRGIIGEINDISATISAAVEEQGASTQEIARNVQQAARGTQEVNENIENVNRAAGETGSASAEVLESAKNLARQSDALRGGVEDFLKEIRAKA